MRYCIPCIVAVDSRTLDAGLLGYGELSSIRGVERGGFL